MHPARTSSTIPLRSGPGLAPSPPGGPQLKPRSSCLSAVSTVRAEAITMLASGSGSR
jgi:hypothetical protein